MRSLIPTILLTFAFVAFETATANANTPKSGKTTVSIKSGDGLSGYQDIMAAKTPKPITISADLYMPKACGSEKMAAVIIQHGSGSPENPWYPKLAKELNKNGIIAIVPNSFKARGLSATGKDQSKLSKATRLFDTFSTFKYLQGLSCVDPNRVGLTGYSFGGIISIDSVEEALASRLGNGFVYKATLPVYPSCQASFENTKSTKTKVHILAGSADDFTPAKYCVEGVKVKQGKGWDIQITLLDGAHHGFNNDYPPKKNPNSWTFGDCGALSIDADGYEVSRQHNASTRSGWGTFVKTMAKKCGRKGVTVGGTDAFAAKTLDFTVRYFKENL